jgi:hypothetical protein
MIRQKSEISPISQIFHGGRSHADFIWRTEESLNWLSSTPTLDDVTNIWCQEQMGVEYLVNGIQVERYCIYRLRIIMQKDPDPS